MTNLKDILKGKCVILCLGNIDRGDDGVGIHIARALKGKVSYEVIEAGTVPENYTGLIKKLEPDTLIIVDAIYFDGEPGEIKLFKAEDLRSGKISTHDVSPKLLIEYLSSSIDVDIFVLGIRPKSNKFGQGLSEQVKQTAGKLEQLLT